VTVEELKAAVLALDPETKQAFILATLPDLGREAVKDPAFLPQLLPIMLGLIRESGVDMAQLLQLANLFAANQPPVTIDD